MPASPSRHFASNHSSSSHIQQAAAMAKLLLLSISLCLLVLFNGCLARLQYQQLNDCLLNQLRAMEPDNRIQAEAGEIESWNPDHDEFQCAGVAVLRRTIQPRGLLLPSFSNAPQVTYIIRGGGVTGILIPGCPETFQESQRSKQGQGSQGFQDRHQRVRRFVQGDVLVMPAGIAHWCYNNGDEPVIAVTLLDTANGANQLDNDPRSFYLAGSSDDEFQQQQSKGERRGRRGQQGKSNNVMAGFDTRLLAEVFKINEQVARKIQGENDYRGNIVFPEGELQFVLPPKIQEEEWEQQSREQGRQANAGFCTLRLKENIGSSRHADIFNPEAGLISIANSHKLPVLRHVQLSVERGVLFKEALDGPHWTINAHSIVYGIDGEAKIQVVDNRGQNVFDGVLREGQILVVPQNFAVVKRCESDRFEWVAFKTNDNAMVAPLADRSSVIRALPLDVISNAFQLCEQDAWRFKFSRKEVRVVPGRSSRSQRRADA